MNRKIHPILKNGIPEITPRELMKRLQESLIIDVRSREEFTGELGHIPGARLATLGEDLTRLLENLDKSQEIVFVCRSGARSGTATEQSVKMGFDLSANLRGGMLSWNELGFPTEK